MVFSELFLKRTNFCISIFRVQKSGSKGVLTIRPKLPKISDGSYGKSHFFRNRPHKNNKESDFKVVPSLKFV